MRTYKLIGTYRELMDMNSDIHTVVAQSEEYTLSNVFLDISSGDTVLKIEQQFSDDSPRDASNVVEVLTKFDDAYVDLTVQGLREKGYRIVYDQQGNDAKPIVTIAKSTDRLLNAGYNTDTIEPELDDTHSHNL